MPTEPLNINTLNTPTLASMGNSNSLPAPVVPAGTLQLIPNPSAQQVLDSTLDGFPYTDGTIYGNRVDGRVALFSEGIAAGFKVDRGVVLAPRTSRRHQLLKIHRSGTSTSF